MREAVKALAVARELNVGRGDGTYVATLEQRLLLQGLAFATDLLQDDKVMDLFEVRRLLEPATTGTSSTRVDAAGLAALRGILDDKAAVRNDADDADGADELRCSRC